MSSSAHDPYRDQFGPFEPSDLAPTQIERRERTIHGCLSSCLFCRGGGSGRSGRGLRQQSPAHNNAGAASSTPQCTAERLSHHEEMLLFTTTRNLSPQHFEPDDVSSLIPSSSSSSLQTSSATTSTANSATTNRRAPRLLPPHVSKESLAAAVAGLQSQVASSSISEEEATRSVDDGPRWAAPCGYETIKASQMQRFANGAQCQHFQDWRRIRWKKGIAKMGCLRCGHKWQSKPDPQSAKGKSHPALPASIDT